MTSLLWLAGGLAVGYYFGFQHGAEDPRTEMWKEKKRQKLSERDDIRRLIDWTGEAL